MDGIRIFCDDGDDTCKRLIETTRLAAQEASRRVIVCSELRCKENICPIYYLNSFAFNQSESDMAIESRKMIVGPIENDSVMQLKIGDKLKITIDEKVVGTKGVISVKNCTEFSENLIE